LAGGADFGSRRFFLRLESVGWLCVIASGAKQSSAGGGLDCFCARNDSA
jgi:hypothetical protein